MDLVCRMFQHPVLTDTVSDYTRFKLKFGEEDHYNEISVVEGISMLNRVILLRTDGQKLYAENVEIKEIAEEVIKLVNIENIFKFKGALEPQSDEDCATKDIIDKESVVISGDIAIGVTVHNSLRLTQLEVIATPTPYGGIAYLMRKSGETKWRAASAQQLNLPNSELEFLMKELTQD